jgi:hypothetical protein
MDNDLIEANEDEKDYNLLIESLELKINKKYNNLLRTQGKLLHETEHINILYYIFINKSTEINPFEVDIEMSVEFIEKEPPYIQILTNFLEPTLYDLKNYFLCLTKKTDYIFEYKYLGKCQIVFLDIISNIQPFLFYLYNCELFKTFIYFGEYHLNHIYHINNFLKNDEALDFFRINRTENSKLFNKILYIIITELYLLVFEPENNNKSLGKILFYKKLSEISIQFEEVYCLKNDKIKKKLKLIISDIKMKILFKEDYNKENSINEEIKIVESDYNINNLKNINQPNLRKSINKKDLKNNNKNLKNHNNEHSINNINKLVNPLIAEDRKNKNIFCYKFEFLFINTDENKDNIQVEYEYFKKFGLKKLVLNKKEYKNIISPYFLLFNCLNSIDIKNYSLEENKDEINKLIEYNEKLFQKYFRRINNIEKIILNNAIKNIIFLCSEMTSCLINDDDTIINFYVEKLKKYSNIKL